MSAPPGVEIIFLIFLSFLIVIGIAVGAAVVAVIRRVSKVKLNSTEKIGIAGLAIVLFTISSLPVQAVGEKTTVYIAFRDPYDVTWLYYGFPVIWAYKFEPVDPSARHLFLIPGFHNVLGLFADFTFWLLISVVLVYSVKIAHTHARPKGANIFGAK
jgi:hypothetical protein